MFIDIPKLIVNGQWCLAIDTAIANDSSSFGVAMISNGNTGAGAKKQEKTQNQQDLDASHSFSAPYFSTPPNALKKKQNLI
ncbi:hypothetical protein [Alcaligenes faecalis]|uniref:hypothetical protein n=1 Tax=Alcaligenes faecalis TaxID=511 RepID=UPI001E64072F|nr:hypothetical protein [Alcaligenes faecalis]